MPGKLADATKSVVANVLFSESSKRQNLQNEIFRIVRRTLLDYHSEHGIEADTFCNLDYPLG
jgi:hypothetical protein